MQLKDSVEKTNNFFNKTIQNLKSFFFGEYRKLSKTHLLNPFSCVSCSSKSLPTNDYYAEFLNGWESDLEKTRKKRKISEEPLMERDANPGQVSYDQEVRRNREKKPVVSCSVEREEKSKQKKKNVKGGDKASIAKKIKDLDMIDVGDIEQALDVEEAVHYYSLLRSPVYLDIVDKFFTDIQASSASFKNSKRRHGSVRF